MAKPTVEDWKEAVAEILLEHADDIEIEAPELNTLIGERARELAAARGRRGEAMTPQQHKQHLLALAECKECGMLCKPNEYHPFAACLMYKGCGDSATVRANLPARLDDGQAKDAALGAKVRQLCNGSAFDLTDSPKSFVATCTHLIAECDTAMAAPPKDTTP